MGVESKTVIKITCDNPNCPGTDLPDPKSYDGWIRVNATTQVTPVTTKDQPSYVQPIQMGEQIFCSATCAGSIQETLTAAQEAREAAAAAAEAAREALANAPKIDTSLPTPEA